MILSIGLKRTGDSTLINAHLVAEIDFFLVFEIFSYFWGQSLYTQTRFNLFDYFRFISPCFLITLGT